MSAYRPTVGELLRHERNLRIAAEADLGVARAALLKIKQWHYLNPPEFHTYVPAFDFMWLRDTAAAGLYGSGKKE